MNKLRFKSINEFKYLRFVFFTFLFCFINTTIFSKDRGNKVQFVGLTYFYAEYIDGQMLLKWETATEINSYGYEVCRGDSAGNWNTLDFVPGAGNSYSPKSYLFIDKNPRNRYNLYTLRQIETDGSIAYSDTVEVSIITGIEGDLLNSFELFQNYPNPFNPTTEIGYSLPKASNVTLKIYNTIGQKVAVLVNKRQEAGMYNVSFNAASLSSGIYFYSIRTDENISVKKMMLLR